MLAIWIIGLFLVGIVRAGVGGRSPATCQGPRGFQGDRGSDAPMGPWLIPFSSLPENGIVNFGPGTDSFQWLLGFSTTVFVVPGPIPEIAESGSAVLVKTSAVTRLDRLSATIVVNAVTTPLAADLTVTLTVRAATLTSGFTPTPLTVTGIVPAGTGASVVRLPLQSAPGDEYTAAVGDRISLVANFDYAGDATSQSLRFAISAGVRCAPP